jgi:ABC-type sulfate transport system substrate-binding protein
MHQVRLRRFGYPARADWQATLAARLDTSEGQSHHAEQSDEVVDGLLADVAFALLFDGLKLA